MDTSKNLIQSIDAQKKIKRIGLFDSGVGGLSILIPLAQQFPAEYVYVADNKYMPYGNKSSSYIIERALIITQFLIECDVDLVIIACNAAYCSAYQKLQAYFPHVPLVSIVDPIVNYAVHETKSKKISILATQATINSGLYKQKLYALDKDLEIFEQSCPDLALNIEQNNEKAVNNLLVQYTKSMSENKIDTVLLACTHYGLIIDKIRALVAPATVLSIHEHTKELLPSAFPIISSSSINLFMSHYTDDEDKRIRLFFPKTCITINSFNN